MPSPSPTNVPSFHPSAAPSEFPSRNPSATPSMTPTDLPSNTPTIIPTELPTEDSTFSPTFVHIQYNLTFSNDFDKVVENSLSDFLQDCTNAVQKLGDFEHVICVEAMSGSIIVTLEGPLNEVEEVVTFIEKSEGLLLDTVALILEEHEGTPIGIEQNDKESEDEEGILNFLQTYFAYIVSFLLVQLIIYLVCGWCYKKYKKSTIPSTTVNENITQLQPIHSDEIITKRSPEAIESQEDMGSVLPEDDDQIDIKSIGPINSENLEKELFPEGEPGTISYKNVTQDCLE